MSDRSSRQLVTPRAVLTILTALAASLALAVPPASAQANDNANDNANAPAPGNDNGPGAQDERDEADQEDTDTDEDGTGDDAAAGDEDEAEASNDAEREDPPVRRGNPIEHCLPDQARDGDGSEPGAPETGTAGTPETGTAGTPETGTAGTPETGTAGTPETGTAGAPETGTAGAPETGTAGAPETGTARSDVAECVQEALPDIARNTHADSIVSVAIERIAQGHPDGTFRPQNPVSRAQMGTFLTRALDLEAPEGEVDAPDVDGDHPHAEGVAAVIDSGIAVGKADGSFGPGEPVSRGQMATFLTRALDLAAEGGDVPEDAAGSAHEEAITAVLEAEIAEGFPDGSFQPPAPVTRGQMATFLARGLDLGPSA